MPRLPIDGLDIWPLLEGQAGAKSPHDAYFFYWQRHLQAVRSGRWKLHFPHPYRTLDGSPGQDGKQGPDRQVKTGLALYDLQTDPGEKTDVSAQHPDVVERLKKLADKERSELGDSATWRTGRGVRLPAE